MEEEVQELAQIQQQQHQDAIKQHQKANSKDLQIKLEQEHQDAIRQRQDAIDIEQQRQNAIRQQQEEAKATQIQQEQQHQDAIEQQRQKNIRQQQEEAKATQIQHEQQRQDAIEQQQRQETQCAAQLFQFGASEWRGGGGGEEEEGGGVFVRSPKAKKMEDRLSPKAQDLVKKSAKVKSAFSGLVVEERKERKRASESKSRKKGFTEGLRVDTEQAQQQRAPSADLHAREMYTIDEIEADLIREVQEVQYNFPSPPSL
jgi:hypothetical protein